MYKDTVLPRILEQVVNCKDELAQYYLMDCIIQVFPDEYHLQTLETLLGACPQLQAMVDIKTVLSQLMDRVSNYASSSAEVLPEFLQVEAFAKLSNAIGKVIEAQVDMPVVGFITLYVSLLTFTLRVHPDRLDYVDQVLIICVVRKHILIGGPKRLAFMVPPLIFSALKLVRRLQGQDGDVVEEVCATPKKIFQLLHQTVESLLSVPAPELALRLYLQCAEVANDCDLEPIAYEFFTQAFILYEEEVAYSAKLLKKPDQCRAVYACSHLFWVDDQDGIKDGERVLLCLKRALRIANAAQQMANVSRGSSGPVTLFVEILNKYLYFFEKGNPQITTAAIQGLVELITTEMQSDTTTSDPSADAFFASTMRYIQFQKQKGGVMGEKYEPLKV